MSEDLSFSLCLRIHWGLQVSFTVSEMEIDIHRTSTGSFVQVKTGVFFSKCWVKLKVSYVLEKVHFIHFLQQNVTIVRVLCHL